MATEICEGGNSAPIAMLRDLPSSQGGSGRHKCAICAYTLGYQTGFKQLFNKPPKAEFIECKHGSKAPADLGAKLHRTQGGVRRHQCVTCAYAEGLLNGERKAQAAEADPADLPRGVLTIAAPPPSKARGTRSKTRSTGNRAVDYLKLQRENSALGEAGERLVMSFEKEQLTRNGRPDLAGKVEHTAKVVGDTAGYDISSFDAEGNKRFIEVKTTTGPAETPFYLSANELDFGNDNSEGYFLYRVFDYDPTTGNAKLYISHGAIATDFSLTPVVFAAARK